MNVCVIGAGLSGIVTIKELQEKHHQVTCFEKNEDIGGVFSNMGTYDSVLLTVSNYFMAFSDFMPVDERLKFWTRKEYKAYLLRYIEYFNLKNVIEFEANVVAIKKKKDQWEVAVSGNGEEKKHYFDAIAVCSGQFQQIKMPQYEGMNRFKGEIYHSTDYKNAAPFKGKAVLCIGMGESSADITTEISEISNKTILSLRRYPMIAPRYILDQDLHPTDYTIDVSTGRFLNSLPRDMHQQFHEGLFQRYLKSHDPAMRLNGKWNKAAGIEHRQVITKNERVFNAIVDGNVQTNIGGIKKFTETTVIFNDDQEEEIDTILCCTGFEFSIPFMDLPLNNPRELYKQMFHPDFKSSLAFIGFVRPQQGGVPVLAELQARYFALLCSHEKTLPPLEALRTQIKKDKKRWEEEFSVTPHVSSLVNYAHFAEDLARCIGCEFKDNGRKEKALLRKCWQGPLWGIQYRLRGPGARPEKARQILLEKTPILFKLTRLKQWKLGIILWLRKVLPVKQKFKSRSL